VQAISALSSLDGEGFKMRRIKRGVAMENRSIMQLSRLLLFVKSLPHGWKKSNASSIRLELNTLEILESTQIKSSFSNASRDRRYINDFKKNFCQFRIILTGLTFLAH